jgi:hypothetical protein
MRHHPGVGRAGEFCDLPAIKGATGPFLLGIIAEVAQLEAGLISERTKAALGASIAVVRCQTPACQLQAASAPLMPSLAA